MAKQCKREAWSGNTLHKCLCVYKPHTQESCHLRKPTDQILDGVLAAKHWDPVSLVV